MLQEICEVSDTVFLLNFLCLFSLNIFTTNPSVQLMVSGAQQ